MTGELRTFGILPAAGNSIRMGRPKLLIQVGGKALIEHAIKAFNDGGVPVVIVVTKPGDEELAEVARDSGAEVVTPLVPPPDMKSSILAALRQIQHVYRPDKRDAWLMAPGDIPRLSSTVIRGLLEHYRANVPSILVPCHGNRRGHPVVMPWFLAERVARLAVDQGVNQLVAEGPVEYLDFGPEAVPIDIDTPEDLERLWRLMG